MDEQRPSCVPDTDSSGPIQAAIDAAHDAGGGTVVVPPGTWTLSRPLHLRDHVTLRGTTLTGCVLDTVDAQDGLIVEDAEGWAVEHLTVAGAGVLVTGGTRFGIIRRVWIRDVDGAGLCCDGGTIEHFCVESLAVERAGASGVAIAADADSAGIFLSEISVRDFGLQGEPGLSYAAVHLQSRCIVTQLHVEPVNDGQVGLLLDEGSDHTTISGLYAGCRGGSARQTVDGVEGISISTEAVRELAQT